MTTTIPELQTDHSMLTQAAQMLKAVAHPVRLSIMSALAHGKLTVSEIFGRLGVEQAVASHHLAIMKDRGVLLAERDGKNVYYSLRFPKMVQIVDCVFDCCERTAMEARN